MTVARWVIGGVIVLYFAFGVAEALRTGVANQAGSLISRRRAPVHFWLLMTGWFVFAAFILVGLFVWT